MLGGMVAVSAFSPLVWHHAFGRILIAFAIYRLWEIAKWFPLKPLEKLPKGFGLMADDVAAAIIALVITLHMPSNVWDSLGLTLPVVVPKP
jgi:phosphatidylglycerophosphatase A